MGKINISQTIINTILITVITGLYISAIHIQKDTYYIMLSVFLVLLFTAFINVGISVLQKQKNGYVLPAINIILAAIGIFLTIYIYEHFSNNEYIQIKPNSIIYTMSQENNIYALRKFATIEKITDARIRQNTGIISDILDKTKYTYDYNTFYTIKIFDPRYKIPNNTIILVGKKDTIFIPVKFKFNSLLWTVPLFITYLLFLFLYNRLLNISRVHIVVGFLFSSIVLLITINNPVVAGFSGYMAFIPAIICILSIVFLTFSLYATKSSFGLFNILANLHGRSSSEEKIKSQIHDLINDYKDNEDIVKELQSALTLINVKEEGKAIAALSKIIENLLKTKLENDEEFNRWALDREKQNPTRKIDHFARLQYAKDKRIFTRLESSSVDTIRLLRNDESHQVGVEHDSNTTLPRLLDCIQIISKFKGIN